MAKCDCYYQHGMKFVCYGTKEMEECSCGGDTSKCDFYPEKRNQKTMANEKRMIDAHDLWSDIMMLPHNGDMISSEEVEQAIKEAPTVDAVELPCKMGDTVWGIKKYNRRLIAKQGVVRQMWFGDDMRLGISVRDVCAGEWGKNIFATKEEVEAAIEKNGGGVNG